MEKATVPGGNAEMQMGVLRAVLVSLQGWCGLDSGGLVWQ